MLHILLAFHSYWRNLILVISDSLFSAFFTAIRRVDFLNPASVSTVGGFFCACGAGVSHLQ
jgi:hypothetical protein